MIRSTKPALAENVIACSVSNPEKSDLTVRSSMDFSSTRWQRISLSRTASRANGTVIV